MKLSLWKREIQEVRKNLKYKIWDKLDLVLDKNTLEHEDFNKWKDYFELLLKSKVIIMSQLENESFTFSFNDENIKDGDSIKLINNENLNTYNTLTYIQSGLFIIIILLCGIGASSKFNSDYNKYAV